MTIRLPNDTQRHAIVGMTGSGKTQFGLWCLSHRSYDRMPWCLIDYKRDPTIARIPTLEEVKVTGNVPKQPGLYVVRPIPEVDDDAVEDFLWRIWKRGKTGVFLDEAYMIGRFNKSFRALLTQGRSKRIPVITLSQRPAWVSPFIFSESEFISVFYLQTDVDVKRVQEWIPNADPYTLAQYNSYYRDALKRQTTLLGPAGDESSIMERFAMRARRRLSIL